MKKRYPCAKVAIMRLASPLDTFSVEKRKVSKSETVVFVRNDIQAFFQQQRLAELGSGVQEELTKMLNEVHENKLSNIPEDRLPELVKSRYIQSPADVERYVRSCKYNVDSYISEIKSEYEKSQSPVADPAATPSE